MAIPPKPGPWILHCALACLLSLCAARLSAQTEPAPAFRTDIGFEQALAEASKAGKLVFVDFFTTWCGPCKQLDQTTWRDPGVIAMLKDRTIALRIDAEKDTALAAKYSVNAYPTLAFIRPDGSLVDKLVGYRDAPTFSKEFTALLSGKTMVDMAQDAVKAAGSDPEKLAQARYELGRQLAIQGKNKEALDEFLWCFDTGMKGAPSYAGVRVSFLLNDIAELGSGYPPALDALRARRDKDKGQALSDSPAALEFLSINRALHDNASTLAFYETLPQGSPTRDTLGLMIFSLYLEKKDYAKAVAAFPLAKYREAVGRFPASLTSSPGVKAFLDSTEANEVEALAGSGDRENAQSLIRDMLARDGSAATRDLIQRHLARAGMPQLMAADPGPAGAPAAKTVDAPAQAAPAPGDEPPPPEIEKSTVKIFVTARGPNVLQPWMKGAPKDGTASGVVVEGHRILTTAHAVAYSNDIQVQANQAGDKISASVALINWDMGLALLKLDDESFFDTHPPIQREQKLPQLKDPLFVYGFPVGGASLSITKGIISRIEYAVTGYPNFGLRVQIDAAINEGNAGGPAVSQGKMVGIALSRLGGAQNIGYVAPNEEIELFLKDAAGGTPTRRPGYYDFWQSIESPALRNYLGLPKSESGVAVRSLGTKDPNYPVKQWDVIEKVGGYAVDDQGMVRVGELRLDLRYAARKDAVNGRVPMDVFRQGQHLHLDVPLNFQDMVMPGVEGKYPPYFIFGPIVFTKCTQALATTAMDRLRLTGTLTFDRSPITERRGDTMSFADEEIVVVPCAMFPNDLSIGYKNPSPRAVEAVNGIKVKNLRHLVEILRDATGDFVTVTFTDRYREMLVFPRVKTLSATDTILADNDVRAQASPDLLEVWNAKSAK